MTAPPTLGFVKLQSALFIFIAQINTSLEAGCPESLLRTNRILQINHKLPAASSADTSSIAEPRVTLLTTCPDEPIGAPDEHRQTSNWVWHLLPKIKHQHQPWDSTVVSCSCKLGSALWWWTCGTCCTVLHSNLRTSGYIFPVYLYPSCHNSSGVRTTACPVFYHFDQLLLAVGELWVNNSVSMVTPPLCLGCFYSPVPGNQLSAWASGVKPNPAQSGMERNQRFKKRESVQWNKATVVKLYCLWSVCKLKR